MVNDVVAVVEAAAIVPGVDAGDAVLEGARGVAGVDEGVLRPVAHHHEGAHHEHRDHEDHEGRLPAHEGPEQRHPCPEPQLPARDAAREARAVLADEVAHQERETHEEERQVVAEPGEEAVPLVAHRGAEIRAAVVLLVVHPEVMPEVRMRGLPVEDPEHHRDVVVESPVPLPKERTMRHTVQHQDVAIEEEHAPDRPVADGQPPAEAPPREQSDGEGHLESRHGEPELDEDMVAGVVQDGAEPSAPTREEAPRRRAASTFGGGNRTRRSRLDVDVEGSSAARR